MVLGSWKRGSTAGRGAGESGFGLDWDRPGAGGLGLGLDGAGWEAGGLGLGLDAPGCWKPAPTLASGSWLIGPPPLSRPRPISRHPAMPGAPGRDPRARHRSTR